MPDYLSCVDTAAKWGISKRRVAILCAEERIPGAFKISAGWVIPADAEKPPDSRRKVHKLKEEKSKGKGGEDA